MSNLDLEIEEYCIGETTENVFQELRFGYATIVGRGTKRRQKKNQDAYITCENLVDGIHLFAIADGHGKNGALCSMMVKYRLPILLIDELMNQNFDIEKSIMNACRAL